MSSNKHTPENKFELPISREVFDSIQVNPLSTVDETNQELISLITALIERVENLGTIIQDGDQRYKAKIAEYEKTVQDLTKRLADLEQGCLRLFVQDLISDKLASRVLSPEETEELAALAYGGLETSEKKNLESDHQQAQDPAVPERSEHPSVEAKEEEAFRALLSKLALRKTSQTLEMSERGRTMGHQLDSGDTQGTPRVTPDTSAESKDSSSTLQPRPATIVPSETDQIH